MSTVQATNLKNGNSVSNNIVLDASGNAAFAGAVTVAGTFQAAGLTTPVYPLIRGTAQATTSGTSINFTGIPSWVTRVTVMFNGVSTNGTSQVRVRIGPVAGVETSGYLGTSQTTLGGTSLTQNFTAGFDFFDGSAAAANRNGVMLLCLLDAATNTWAATANIGASNEARMVLLGGVKPIAGVLSVVSITTVNGTDTFDAGSVNLLWE